MTGQGGNPNIIFRIPTPLFGAGLIEGISDSAILANMQANASAKSALGIHGHANAHLSGNANLSANDGTITRFGWKAQNKSLLMFAGEAYNVEMGISNQLFPQERDETPGCIFNPLPTTLLTSRPLLRPPAIRVAFRIPRSSRTSKRLPTSCGCWLHPRPPRLHHPAKRDATCLRRLGVCTAIHRRLPQEQVIASGSATSPSAALSNQTANLFSDLLVHRMGEGLADGITQGGAGPDEFRTAPLWGVGERVFFLHDGRTSNLVDAIRAHQSRGSEANKVIEHFNELNVQEQQEIIDFLRSL